MFPCKKLLEFDLEMVLNFSENANILEYEIKFEKNSRACDWLSETWDMGLLFERARRFRLVFVRIFISQLANMSNVNADAAAAAAVAAVAACNPAAAERLYAWQWPDGTDPVLATKLNAILVQQLGVSSFSWRLMDRKGGWRGNTRVKQTRLQVSCSVRHHRQNY